jgi:hypothetical protein
MDNYVSSFVQCIGTYDFDGGITDIISEYLNLPTSEDVEQMTGMKFRGYEPFDSKLTTSVTGLLDIPQDLKSVRQLRWGLSRSPKMPLKPRFKRWIFSIFVKIMKPPPQEYPLIGQPHTTTTFLRLCSYLVQVRRIPQHWISEVLDTLLSGTITTPFLPVLKSPQPPEEALKNLSGTDLKVSSRSIHPFVPELHTLLSIYHEEFRFNRLICFTPMLPLQSMTLMKSDYWLTLPRHEDDLGRYMWGLVADDSRYMENTRKFEAALLSLSNEEREGLYPVVMLSKQNKKGKKSKNICRNSCEKARKAREVGEVYVFNNFFIEAAGRRHVTGPHGELGALVRVSIWVPLDLEKRFESLTVVLVKSESSVLPRKDLLTNYPKPGAKLDYNSDVEDIADGTSKLHL